MKVLCKDRHYRKFTRSWDDYFCDSCNKKVVERKFFPVRWDSKANKRIGDGRIDWYCEDKLIKKLKNHTCKARLKELSQR